MPNIVSLLLLLVAGLMEVGFTTSLKMTNGFANIPWTVAAVLFGMASFVFLGLAMRALPMGATYAAWTGLGIVGTALVGALVLGDRVTWPVIVGTLFILVGVMLLNLARVGQG